MALNNNLTLLFLSIFLLISFHSALSDLSPAVSPSESSPELAPVPSPSLSEGPESAMSSLGSVPAPGPTPSPGPASGPTLSPTPAKTVPLNHVSFPPSISDPPSSFSPDPNAQIESDESPSPSPVSIDSDAEIESDGSPPPSTSPDQDYPDESDGPSKLDVSTSPSTSPDQDTAVESDGPSKFDVSSILSHLPSSSESAGSDITQQLDVSSILSNLPSSSNSPDSVGSDGSQQFDVSSILSHLPSSISPESVGSDGPKFDISSFLSLSTNDNVNPKVKEICDSTDHPSLCLATVTPFLNGKNDVSSVLKVAIKAGAKISEYGLSLAKSLADKSGTPPELASILKDCKDSYDSVVYNYENAMDALGKHDIGTMNAMLSAAITDVGDCEDAFSGSGEKSVLSDIADKLTNMTSNCLAIVSLLK